MGYMVWGIDYNDPYAVTASDIAKYCRFNILV